MKGKIIQIMEWEGDLTALTDEGEIYYLLANKEWIAVI